MMEDEEEMEYNRQSADPSITVADLEGALENFFAAMEDRGSLRDVLNQIAKGKCTWKTSAKAWA